jgi:GNAT superfamily N-acetyltransferase
MIAVERNAAGIDAAYLHGLATCFPGAWNEASYRWYLGRPFRCRGPDKVTAHDGKTVIAGLGINYRRVRSAAGGIHDVGILTAGWTLPQYRGRGCYSRMLDAAIEIATHDDCAALVGFVTATSLGASRLRRVGAVEVPTRYLFLEPEDSVRPPGRQPAIHAVRAPTAAAPLGADAGSVFHYADAEEWQAQFVRRPGRTTIMEVDAGVAVVEHAGATDRLQFLSRPHDSDAAALVAMALRARDQGRHFFSFTTDERLAERAAAHGLRQMRGAVLILDLKTGAAARTALSSSSWHVQPGDRM